MRPSLSLNNFNKLHIIITPTALHIIATRGSHNKHDCQHNQHKGIPTYNEINGKIRGVFDKDPLRKVQPIAEEGRSCINVLLYAFFEL
jgi:hypothetical protein